jgi:hypothetical protein
VSGGLEWGYWLVVTARRSKRRPRPTRRQVMQDKPDVFTEIGTLCWFEHHPLGWQCFLSHWQCFVTHWQHRLFDRRRPHHRQCYRDYPICSANPLLRRATSHVHHHTCHITRATSHVPHVLALLGARSLARDTCSFAGVCKHRSLLSPCAARCNMSIKGPISPCTAYCHKGICVAGGSLNIAVRRIRYPTGSPARTEEDHQGLLRSACHSPRKGGFTSRHPPSHHSSAKT